MSTSIRHRRCGSIVEANAKDRTLLNPIYAALAQAFAAEGIDTHFTLMGDGNMPWAAMKGIDGMSAYAALP